MAVAVNRSPDERQQQCRSNRGEIGDDRDLAAAFELQGARPEVITQPHWPSAEIEPEGQIHAGGPGDAFAGGP